MKLVKYISILTVGLLLMSFLPLPQKQVVIVPLPAVDGGLAIIANAKGAPSDLGLTKLKGVFKGEQQRWKDGTKVTLALMKTSTPIGTEMTEKIFGMTTKELNKYILAQVFQGKMSSPQFFESEEDLIKYVENNEGAIGVISFKSSTGKKTVNIDGKKSI